jgi:hypothetical protein
VQTLLSFAIVIDVVLALVGLTSKAKDAIEEDKPQEAETIDAEIEHATAPQEH